MMKKKKGSVDGMSEDEKTKLVGTFVCEMNNTHRHHRRRRKEMNLTTDRGTWHDLNEDQENLGKTKLLMSE